VAESVGDAKVNAVQENMRSSTASEPLTDRDSADYPSAGRCPHPSPPAPADWQTAMRRAIRSTTLLRRHVGLSGDDGDASRPESAFGCFVPLEFAARIRLADPEDPLLKQVLPIEAENVDVPGFGTDPVGDMAAEVNGGLLHKYAGRALIVTHGTCAVHCRYCFRREFPYAESATKKERWRPAIEAIVRDTSISEVLLSGGDPLTLGDGVLDALLESLESIPHVRRLRIHTRLPVVIPQRVTDSLTSRLANSRLTTWMVVHTNHAQEIDDAVANSFDKLVSAGIPLLNQAVLLAGVNDSVDALRDLSMKLIDLKVQPYYLHQLDRVRGAAHFWVPVERGIKLMEQLRHVLPGYALPRYVIEEPGAKSKTPIA
jgi:EF-P beta-lysylation protein EpmB